MLRIKIDISKWNEKSTLLENAASLQVTKARAYYMSLRHGLKFLACKRGVKKGSIFKKKDPVLPHLNADEVEQALSAQSWDRIENIHRERFPIKLSLYNESFFTWEGAD